MTIKYHDFYVLFGAATKEQERDRYIMEWSSSSIFYPGENVPDINAAICSAVVGRIGWNVEGS